MRVLNDATHEVGHRVARILLSQESVDYVGLWHDNDAGKAPRSGPATDVDGFDLVITDRTDSFDDLLARASVQHVPIVIWGDAANIAQGPTAAPVVVGANVGSALTKVMETHASAAVSDDDTVTRAWTEPGAPLRNGHPVAFPEPVGVAWTRRRSEGEFVAFRDDDWGGAVVRVEGPGGDRVIGAADHAAHLEALVLAASGLATFGGDLPSVVQPAAALCERLMNALREVELDFAVWRSTV